MAVVRSLYAPERGDVVSLEFNPQAGSEQAGRRPGLVVSPSSYNRKVGLALICPITHKAKGYPFEVEIPPGLKVKGTILCDHIKSLDWQARHASPLDRVPDETMAEVTAKVVALVDPE